MKTPLAALAALALAAHPAHAQIGLEYADGVLGYEAVFRMNGTAGELYGLAPSLTEGPTSLAAFGAPSLALDVGLELIAYWKVGLLDASGFAEVAYALPNDPGLSGVTLFAQAVAGSPATAQIDSVSDRVSFTFVLEGSSYLSASASAPRRHHTATALDDGRVLVAGGLRDGAPGGPPIVHPSFEIFDPQTEQFGPVGALLSRRAHHTATRLQDGRVLLVGGVGAAGAAVLATAEIVDPRTGASAATATMAAPRVRHTATLLDDGRVLVVGGASSFDVANPIGYPASTTAAIESTTEIYDPLADTWSPGPAILAVGGGNAVGLMGHTATLLADRTVLIVGGLESPAPGAVAATSSCRSFDPSTGTLIDAPSLPYPVAFHAAASTSAGGVMIAGGSTVDLVAVSMTGTLETSAYDAVGASWSSTGPLNNVRNLDGTFDCICKDSMPGTGPTFVICPLVPPVYALGGGIGSFDLATGTGQPVAAVETIDSSMSGWTVIGSQTLPREFTTVTPIVGSSRLLFAGDTGVPGFEAVTEIFGVDY